MLPLEKFYKNHHIISNDFYFVTGMINVLSLINIDIDRKVKIVDVRTSGFRFLEEEQEDHDDVVIIICSQREERYVGFFKMSRCNAIIVCTQIEVAINGIINFLCSLSSTEFLREKKKTINEVLNNNEIDFLRLTLKGFTVLQYSRLRNMVPKTVYGYRNSMASKFGIDIKHLDHLLSKYF